MKISQTIVAGVLALGMGSAFAAEPVSLNDNQMDKITAGSSVVTDLRSDALDLIRDFKYLPNNIGDVRSDFRDIVKDIVTIGH